MFQHSKSSLILATTFAFSSLLATAATGCLVEEDGAGRASDAATGRIEMPLTSVAEDGTIYHLKGVSLEISSSGSPRIVEADDDSSSFSFEVEPGVLSAKLLGGWSLERSTDGGASFAAVGAVLASLNPALVTVRANASSALAFEFLLRNPNGTVNVQFSARQTTGQLTGLFYPRQVTGKLAPYLNGQYGLSLFFQGSSFSLPSEEGPSLATHSWTTALEFHSDPHGVLTQEVGPAMSGNGLHFEVTAGADGGQVVSGDFTRSHQPDEPILVLDEGQLWRRLPLDEAGYPITGAFAGQVPFTLQLNDEEGSMMSGVMNLEYLPNGS